MEKKEEKESDARKQIIAFAMLGSTARKIFHKKE